MLLLPPLPPPQADKERPARRYDQDKEWIRTEVRRPIVEAAGALGEGARTYRLDIELGRLEFVVHPNMAQEDLLVSGWSCVCCWGPRL